MKNREIIRVERQIEVAAQEWEEKNKPASDYLLTGSKLIEAQNYLTDYGDFGYLSTLAKEYIEKSIRQQSLKKTPKFGNGSRGWVFS